MTQAGLGKTPSQAVAKIRNPFFPHFRIIGKHIKVRKSHIADFRRCEIGGITGIVPHPLRKHALSFKQVLVRRRCIDVLAVVRQTDAEQRMHRVERPAADMRKRNNIPRKIRTVRRLMRLVNIHAEIIFLRHFQKPVGKTVIIDSGGKVVSFTRQRMKHSAEIAARPCKIPVSIPRKISPAEEPDGGRIVVEPVIPAGIAVRFRYTLPFFQRRKILQ